MKIEIINNDEITFIAESIIDGMKIGIMKQKIKEKGIPIKLGILKTESLEKLDMTINKSDLLNLIVELIEFNCLLRK
jgi:hypothetical protein